MDLTYIEPKPDDQFNYPYYLHSPEEPQHGDELPILVEPNNTGTTSDRFKIHQRKAKQLARGGFGRQIADRLSVPFLVPVFPRPEDNPVDGTHYIHQLDVETMGIKNNPLERVDLQLLEMVADARERLSIQEYPISEKIIMTGFSASAKFVNRFAVFHPEKLISVTAGGISGMPILPITQDQGYRLDYNVGVANLESLTGKQFDLDAFCGVKQFLYMGEDDENDPTDYPSVWDGHLKEMAMDVYGHDMQGDRFPYSKSVYDDVGAHAVFRMYEDTGHDPSPALDDVVEFHERCLTGDNFENLRSDLDNVSLVPF